MPINEQWCIPPKGDCEFVVRMEDTLEVCIRGVAKGGMKEARVNPESMDVGTGRFDKIIERLLIPLPAFIPLAFYNGTVVLSYFTMTPAITGNTICEIFKS